MVLLRSSPKDARRESPASNFVGVKSDSVAGGGNVEIDEVDPLCSVMGMLLLLPSSHSMLSSLTDASSFTDSLS